MSYAINSLISKARGIDTERPLLSNKIDKATLITDIAIAAILATVATVLILQAHGIVALGQLSAIGTMLGTKGAMIMYATGGIVAISTLLTLMVRQAIRINALLRLRDAQDQNNIPEGTDRPQEVQRDSEESRGHNQQIETLQAQLVGKDQEIAELNQQIINLRNAQNPDVDPQLQRMLQEMNQSRQERLAIQGRLDLLTRQMQEQQNEQVQLIEEKEQEIARLNAQIEENQAVISGLLPENNDEVRAQLADALAEKAALTEQITNLRSELATATQQRDDLQTHNVEIQTLQEQIQEREAQIQEREAQIREREAQIQAANEVKEQLGQHILRLEREKSESDAEVERLTISLNQLTTSSENATAMQQQRYQLEINHLEDLLNGEADKVNTLESKIRRLKQERELLRSNSSTSSSENATIFAQLRTDLENVTYERNQLKIQMTNLRSEKQDRELEHGRIKARSEEIIRDLTQEIARLRSEGSSTQTSSREEELVRQIQTLQGEIESLRIENVELRNQAPLSMSQMAPPPPPPPSTDSSPPLQPQPSQQQENGTPSTTLPFLEQVKAFNQARLNKPSTTSLIPPKRGFLEEAMDRAMERNRAAIDAQTQSGTYSACPDMPAEIKNVILSGGKVLKSNIARSFGEFHEYLDNKTFIEKENDLLTSLSNWTEFDVNKSYLNTVDDNSLPSAAKKYLENIYDYLCQDPISEEILNQRIEEIRRKLDELSIELDLPNPKNKVEDSDSSQAQSQPLGENGKEEETDEIPPPPIAPQEGMNIQERIKEMATFRHMNRFEYDLTTVNIEKLNKIVPQKNFYYPFNLRLTQLKRSKESTQFKNMQYLEFKDMIVNDLTKIRELSIEIKDNPGANNEEKFRELSEKCKKMKLVLEGCDDRGTHIYSNIFIK